MPTIQTYHTHGNMPLERFKMVLKDLSYNFLNYDQKK